MPLLPHWKHDRESFYKYLSANTALAVLESRHLRYSSPLRFNDPFDVQFDLQLDYDRDEALALLRERHWGIYNGSVPFEPKSVAGLLFACIREKRPGASRQEFENMFRGVYKECMLRGDSFLPTFHKEVRSLLRGVKVLCLSEIFDNILMWSHYAKSHTGVVLRLSCITELDSIWGAAQSVFYEQDMPCLLTQDEVVRLLTGEFSLADKVDNEKLLDKLVFTKAYDWSYEKEWRVVMQMTNAEEDFQDIRFAPRELTAIYLGCNASEDTRSQIRRLASVLYPHAEVFQGRKSARRFALEFERIS